jgi:hypothetical protein
VSKHTEGTWHVSELDATGEPSEDYIFIEPGVAVIERKVKGSDQCDMPDAHLISAAKELLAELQHAVRFFDQLTPNDVARYRIAIAKATVGAAQPEVPAEQIGLATLPTYRPVWLQFGVTMHKDVRIEESGWLRRSDVLGVIAKATGAVS